MEQQVLGRESSAAGATRCSLFGASWMLQGKLPSPCGIVINLIEMSRELYSVIHIFIMLYKINTYII